jgi:hypothetical protein
MPAVVIAAGIGAAATAGAAYSSYKSNKNATDAATSNANRAAELEAKSAEDALAFQKEEAAREQKNWEETQARNYQLYLEEQARLKPYRQLGLGSISQIASGIPKASSGSIGSLVGR